MKVYIVITQQVEGNPQVGYATYYYSDLRHFASRAGALRYGFRVLDRGDDFNIGTVEDGKLIAFGWGEGDFGPDEYGDPHGGYDLEEISAGIYLADHRWPS